MQMIVIIKQFISCIQEFLFVFNAAVCAFPSINLRWKCFISEEKQGKENIMQHLTVLKYIWVSL